MEFDARAAELAIQLLAFAKDFREREIEERGLILKIDQQAVEGVENAAELLSEFPWD